MLVHTIMPASRATNGPGVRCVVFVQGCNLGCPGCWNLWGHPFRGTEFAVETILAEVVNRHRQYSLDGVTFSGGEPMQQADDLAKLLQGLRSAVPTLSVGCLPVTRRGNSTMADISRGMAWTGTSAWRSGARSALNLISP